MAFNQRDSTVRVEDESGTALTSYRLHTPSTAYLYLDYTVRTTARVIKSRLYIPVFPKVTVADPGGQGGHAPPPPPGL